MIKTDGTSSYKHTVSDFNMIRKPIVANNSTTFTGTSTVTMKEGHVKDVPTSIKFTDESSVSLWFDPTKTNSHFGNTLIMVRSISCVKKCLITVNSLNSCLIFLLFFIHQNDIYKYKRKSKSIEVHYRSSRNS